MIRLGEREWWGIGGGGILKLRYFRFRYKRVEVLVENKER